MVRPKVIIADEDTTFIAPLQLKFVIDFFDKIDIEIITKRDFFDDFFSKPQNADILIVSEALYDSSLQKHNINNIFVMVEDLNDEDENTFNVSKIAKYTSIKEIFNEIIGKSGGCLNIGLVEKKETQIVLVTSASGGVGKTTMAMGIAASLSQNYKRVLYINASRLQNFQYMLDNETPITAPDVYSKLINPTDSVYHDIKHVIRKEGFSYLPAFKAALMSVGIEYSVFGKIALAAKKSGDYDFIIIDAESTFDEENASLLNFADKVMVIASQTKVSVVATNIWVNNINGIETEKYSFICNDYIKDENNALILPDVEIKFAVSEYVAHYNSFETMKMNEIAKKEDMQRVAYLVI